MPQMLLKEVVLSTRTVLGAGYIMIERKVIPQENLTIESGICKPAEASSRG
jgi:hypothetical protein